MNVVAWARVSSREQKEGYSLDAQMRAIREKSNKEGWKIVKEFAVAESASRKANRLQFDNMLNWVKKNAKKENLRGIVCHKLDRACRNMRDAVRLQDLEESCSVRPLFVENQFGQGAAGLLSFNVMAAVSQYYSDNLRSEVLKGLNEKAEQGWLPSNAPFGYDNDTKDKNEPIKPNPTEAAAVRRIFELYSTGHTSYDAVSDILKREGHIYSADHPKFERTTIRYILMNRFYIGDIEWHGRVLDGKHKPTIRRALFKLCEDIMLGPDRKKKHKHCMPLAGGLIRCKFCGQAITGEQLKRKLKDGTVKEYIYYRCGNDIKEHPEFRWKGDALEAAIVEQLRTLKLPSPEITEWFRLGLKKSLTDEAEFHREKQARLKKRRTEFENKLNRLLDAFISGTVEKSVYDAKALEIRDEVERIKQEEMSESRVNSSFIETVEAAFNLTQRAAETWLVSNWPVKRQLLEIFSLKCELDDASLTITWNKPFCHLVTSGECQSTVER
jgi:DNA invertase Pin-like site-specific DNA recombinase